VQTTKGQGVDQIGVSGDRAGYAAGRRSGPAIAVQIWAAALDGTRSVLNVGAGQQGGLRP
jgi:hypothetical protein